MSMAVSMLVRMWSSAQMLCLLCSHFRKARLVILLFAVIELSKALTLVTGRSGDAGVDVAKHHRLQHLLYGECGRRATGLP